MFQIQQTQTFEKWLRDLRDVRAKARILVRIDSARLGTLGDIRSVGDRVSEMRIDAALRWRQINPGQGHRTRKTYGAVN